jgi:hypothetical protein
MVNEAMTAMCEKVLPSGTEPPRRIGILLAIFAAKYSAITVPPHFS